MLALEAVNIRHGLSRRELLILSHDGGHLDCTSGLRLADCIPDVPRFYDPLSQESNPEAMKPGDPDSEPRSSTRHPRSS